MHFVFFFSVSMMDIVANTQRSSVVQDHRTFMQFNIKINPCTTFKRRAQDAQNRNVLKRKRHKMSQNANKNQQRI